MVPALLTRRRLEIHPWQRNRQVRWWRHCEMCFTEKEKYGKGRHSREGSPFFLLPKIKRGTRSELRRFTLPDRVLLGLVCALPLPGAWCRARVNNVVQGVPGESLEIIQVPAVGARVAAAAHVEQREHHRQHPNQLAHGQSS